MHEPVTGPRPGSRSRSRGSSARCRAHGEDPQEFSRAWDAVTEEEFTPWYRATVAVDRARLAEIEALRNGAELPQPADPAAAVRARFPRAAARDADLFRALMEIVGCMSLPAEVFARPGLIDRVLELTDPTEAPEPPCPTRPALLELLIRAGEPSCGSRS